jgi:hypothetical protein
VRYPRSISPTVVPEGLDDKPDKWLNPSGARVEGLCRDARSKSTLQRILWASTGGYFLRSSRYCASLSPVIDKDG